MTDTTLTELLEKVADGIGELYAAARSDWAAANPEHIGLFGENIKTWRGAYLEGCKDMAEKVGGCVGETNKHAFQQMVEAAFKKHDALISQSAVLEGET